VSRRCLGGVREVSRNLLVGEHVPDAVAPEDDKQVVLINSSLTAINS